MIQAGVILPLWRRSGSGALDAAENDYDDHLQCGILPWKMCSSPSILGYFTIEDSHLAIKHWYVSMKNVWSTAMNRDVTNR
jgi:hypothetical protein